MSGPVGVSGGKRAALVSQASGKPLTFTIMSEVQLRAGLAQTGLPEFLADGLVAMQQAFSNGAYDIVTGDTEPGARKMSAAFFSLHSTGRLARTRPQPAKVHRHRELS